MQWIRGPTDLAEQADLLQFLPQVLHLPPHGEGGVVGCHLLPRAPRERWNTTSPLGPRHMVTIFALPYKALSLKVEHSPRSSEFNWHTWTPLWRKRVVQKARQLMGNPDHILNQEFCLMPSRRRYLAPPRKTNRYASSCIPSAIKLLNATDSSN